MNKEQQKEILKLLKVDYISIPIANTSKGLLALAIRKGESETFLTLDAVPLSEELSKQIYANLQVNTKTI